MSKKTGGALNDSEVERSYERTIEKQDIRVGHEMLAPPERLSALFHMVNRLLPDDQVMLSVSPETPAREALALMRKHGYSQPPVMQGVSVLGLFTYRAFALEVAQIGDAKVDASSLSVEEFLEHEKPAYALRSSE